jgi:hypothetical protein
MLKKDLRADADIVIRPNSAMARAPFATGTVEFVFEAV